MGDTELASEGGRDRRTRCKKAGPEVARILQDVENRWIAEDFPDEARVAALLDEALAG